MNTKTKLRKGRMLIFFKILNFFEVASQKELHLNQLMNSKIKYIACSLLLAFLTSVTLNALIAHNGYQLHKGMVELVHNTHDEAGSNALVFEETENDVEDLSEFACLVSAFLLFDFQFVKPTPQTQWVTYVERTHQPIFLSIRVLRI